MSSFVCGANVDDYHYVGANWQRDVTGEVRVVDFDNDGWLDVFFALTGFEGARVYWNQGADYTNQWRGLRDVLGMDAEDPRFADAAGRKQHEDELDRALAARTMLHDGLALERRLTSAGVPAAVLRNTLDVLHDPHLDGRGYWQWRERAHVGSQPNPSAPFRPVTDDGESRPYAVEWPAPTLGQHNREVLTRLLGLSEDELKVLERDKVIGTEPVV